MLCFLLGNGDKTGLWAQEEWWSHQDRVVERPSCHYAALVEMRDWSPPWAKAEVEAGAYARCLRAGLGVPNKGPREKRMEMGPGPTGTVQHIPAKPAFIFLSLEASITCNSLEVIYINHQI